MVIVSYFLSRLPSRTIAHLAASVALFAVLLLVGCDSDQSVSPNLEQDEVVAATSVPPTRDADSDATLTPSTVAPEESTIDDGVLVHAFFSVLLPDPVVDSPLNDFLPGEVYAGLVRFGAGVAGQVEPDVASSYSVSDGGLRYTFVLRDGLMFSDGTPVTAADVKWSWERALLPETGARRAEDVLSAIRGAHAILDGSATSLDGVTTIDDATLEVSLDRPQGRFLQLLADPLASVLSAENVQNWGTLNWGDLARGEGYQGLGDLVFDELPVGTGPFRLTSFTWDSSATLEPNPFYWEGAPGIGEIRFVNPYTSGSGGSGRELEAWEYDIYPVDRAFADAVANDQAGTFDVGTWSGFDAAFLETAPQVSYLALNTAVAPYDDVNFRRALLLAANREPSTRVMMEEVPDDPAMGLLPPGFPGHDQPTVGLGPDRANAETSFALSRHSSTESSRTLNFVPDASVPYLWLMSDVARNWSEWLGLETNIAGGTSIPLDAFEDLYRKGTLEMRYVYVKPRYPDPHAILGMIPRLFGPRAESDETRKLSAMLESAEALPDRAARLDEYKAIETYILEQALVIPLFWDSGNAYELVKQFIRGYQLPAYHGSRYKNVTIDTTHPGYPTDRDGG